MTEETLLTVRAMLSDLLSLHSQQKHVLEGDRCAWKRVKEESVPQTSGPEAEGDGGHPIA